MVQLGGSAVIIRYSVERHILYEFSIDRSVQRQSCAYFRIGDSGVQSGHDVIHTLF
jgi:hypothetical protein